MVGHGLLERAQLASLLAAAAMLGHLLWDIDAVIECGGCSRKTGEALWGQARQMFHDCHVVRDDALAHARIAHYMRPIRWEIERLLEAGQTCGAPKTEGTSRDLLKRRHVWETFVRHPGVDPTNYAAERAIQPGVF